MKPTRLWLFKLLTFLLPETRCYAFKVSLLRWCGATIGQNVRIVSGVEIVGNGKLSIGDDVFIGAGSRIVAVAPAEVIIGSHIDIAPQVLILTGTHLVEPEGSHMAGRGEARSVKIGDGCWLCARAAILPGVSLAEKTVVAAGSVVTQDVVEYETLVAGVPAKKVKSYA